MITHSRSERGHERECERERGDSSSSGRVSLLFLVFFFLMKMKPPTMEGTTVRMMKFSQA